MSEFPAVGNLVEHLAAKLVDLSRGGSVPAARAAAGLLEQIQIAQEAETHAAQLETLRASPRDLVEYLAYIGDTRAEAEEELGRPFGPPEAAAYRQGERKRIREMRAVRLALARRGKSIRLAPWMENRR